MAPPRRSGAGNETRTRDSYLGKVVLYQLSYARSKGYEEIMNSPGFVKFKLGPFALFGNHFPVQIRRHRGHPIPGIVLDGPDLTGGPHASPELGII